MKSLTRFLTVLLVALSISSVALCATRYVTCTLANNKITKNITVGKSYTNDYHCVSSFPTGFPAVELKPVIGGNFVGKKDSGGDCTMSKLNSKGSCTYSLTLTPTNTGSYHVDVTLYYGTRHETLPTITMTANSDAHKPVIHWPGKNDEGHATIDAMGQGEGNFTANATVTDGGIVTYTYHLNHGRGTVTPGPTLGKFNLSNILDDNNHADSGRTVSITATAKGASPVVGPTIVIKTPNPDKPYITWLSKDQGDAWVDANHDGQGWFRADAIARGVDGSNIPVTYDCKLLNSMGTISQPAYEGDKGKFMLTHVTEKSASVICTAKADGANPVSSNPFEVRETVNPSDAPSKKILIYNNSNQILYPIISSGARPKNETLMAYFHVTNHAEQFPTKKTYVTFINPPDEKTGSQGGLAPGDSVEINMPIYTELAKNPSKTADDQYVTWWNGGRILIGDDRDAVIDELKKSQSVSTFSQALSCKNPGKFGAMTVYSTPGIADEGPFQLLEYTLGMLIKKPNDVLPYDIAMNLVGYNISNVDQLYLPAAMEPYNNPYIGYIGSTKSIEQFRSAMVKFVADTNWPVYKNYPKDRPRIPGAHVVMIDRARDAMNKKLTNPQGKRVDDMVALWEGCVYNGPNTQTCNILKEFKALFDKNCQKYLSLPLNSDPNAFYVNCDGHIKPGEKNYVDPKLLMLQHLYGWVPFNQYLQGSNSLRDTTPTVEDFNKILHKYIAMQYQGLDENGMGTSAFNGYVDLIHGDRYLNMRAAYAFSVDDAVSFMQEEGDGLVIAIGGSKGLENKGPYIASEVTTVAIGPPRTANWAYWGVCTNDPNRPFPKGTNSGVSFKVSGITYPCMVSVKDSQGRVYQVILKSKPPLSSTEGVSVSCQGVSRPAWCSGFNIAGRQDTDLVMPAPTD